MPLFAPWRQRHYMQFFPLRNYITAAIDYHVDYGMTKEKGYAELSIIQLKASRELLDDIIKDLEDEIK